MDTDHHADRAWLLSVQRRLYQWSQKNPDDQYHQLWGWVTDTRNLRCAWRRIASNRGKRTPGIDGKTVRSICRNEGEAAFLRRLRREMRTGAYRHSPCKRKLIPKPGKPGEFRPLGIPTIADRVVQAAVKQVLEPIFEAQFEHVSYGFRPGRSCHGAVEHIRMTIRPRAKSADGRRHSSPYQWVIEGDIKGCFDNIDHHSLMQRLRTRIGDTKVTRLVTQFLNAGVLAEEQFIRTPAGTPQGGVISPLLANIALSVIEERYERWVNHRSKIRRNRKANGVQAALYARSSDRRAGRPVFFPIRYADDFVILVSGDEQTARAEKDRLAQYLRETLKLELSPSKTRITPLTDGFEFLGHRIRLRWDPRYGYTPRVEIPKAKIGDLRYRVKQLTGRRRVYLPLSEQLQALNPVLRGWGNFYRYCTNAKRIFASLDWYVGDRIWRWMRKKYPRANAHAIAHHRRATADARYRRQVWSDVGYEQYLISRIPVCRYKRGWMGTADFATSLGEPDA